MDIARDVKFVGISKNSLNVKDYDNVSINENADPLELEMLFPMGTCNDQRDRIQIDPEEDQFYDAEEDSESNEEANLDDEENQDHDYPGRGRGRL